MRGEIRNLRRERRWDSLWSWHVRWNHWWWRAMDPGCSEIASDGCRVDEGGEVYWVGESRVAVCVVKGDRVRHAVLVWSMSARRYWRIQSRNIHRV